jgi:hypothetical protein
MSCSLDEAHFRAVMLWAERRARGYDLRLDEVLSAQAIRNIAKADLLRQYGTEQIMPRTWLALARHHARRVAPVEARRGAFR